MNEQSGINAGDGGFQINVAGNTDLKGGKVASTDKAAADGKNSLTTQTLTQSDIKNRSDYKAESQSIGIGAGYGGSKLSMNGTGVGIGSSSGSESSTGQVIFDDIGRGSTVATTAIPVRAAGVAASILGSFSVVASGYLNGSTGGALAGIAIQQATLTCSPLN
ncbi:hypothetical protein [Herbaspirillum robiniae]|uniref:hypothetical protein n=1 Tax=Herbaspirillum robiniae TaxID=2014887 RepID=UPI003D772B31